MQLYLRKDLPFGQVLEEIIVVDDASTPPMAEKLQAVPSRCKLKILRPHVAFCGPKSCLCHHWSDQIWKLQVREDQIEIDWRGLQRALVLDKIDCCPVTMKARRFLWPDDCKANWRQWLCSLSTPFFMFCFILVMCILDGWFDWFVIHVSNSSWS